ncbi:MAG TPA: hypothetical protein VFP84_35220 [Kofleriaceae bacterium]|nr:hypothetical protein [Kofleriaceae bacterium]
MAHHDDLPTLDLTALAHVTGGAGTNMASMMLPLLISKRKQSAPAPAPAAPAPPSYTPKVTIDGVPQALTSTASNTFSLGTDPTIAMPTGTGT